MELIIVTLGALVLSGWTYYCYQKTFEDRMNLITGVWTWVEATQDWDAAISLLETTNEVSFERHAMLRLLIADPWSPYDPDLLRAAGIR